LVSKFGPVSESASFNAAQYFSPMASASRREPVKKNNFKIVQKISLLAITGAGTALLKSLGTTVK
jgi:hypothetical protein